MKKTLHILTSSLSVLIIFFVVGGTFSSCRSKGNVEIFAVVDTVQNCSLPYIVNFYPDVSYETDEVIFNWDFGDGTSSSEHAPVHIYQKTGLYQVTLKVSERESVKGKSITLDLQDESIPIISKWDFIPKAKKLWAPAYVDFANMSEHSENFYWNFGDGYSSTEKNPYHVFETVGKHPVKLGAICNGDTVYDTDTLQILPEPTELKLYDLTVAMPDTYIGADVWVRVFFNIHPEMSSVVAEGVSEFPIVFDITEDFFFFSSYNDSDFIEFEIWSSLDDTRPAKIFTMKTRDIQDDYYPPVIGFSDAYGFGLEATLFYE